MSAAPRRSHPGRAVFAANLQAARKRAGLTQEGLANLVSLDRILELSDALGIGAASLMPNAPSEQTYAAHPSICQICCPTRRFEPDADTPYYDGMAAMLDLATWSHGGTLIRHARTPEQAR